MEKRYGKRSIRERKIRAFFQRAAICCGRRRAKCKVLPNGWEGNLRKNAAKYGSLLIVQICPICRDILSRDILLRAGIPKRNVSMSGILQFLHCPCWGKEKNSGKHNYLQSGRHNPQRGLKRGLRGKRKAACSSRTRVL